MRKNKFSARLIRWIFYVLAASALLLFCTWAILSFLFPANQVKKIAERELGELLQKEVAIRT